MSKNVDFHFFLYCTACQHPAQNASTQRHGQPAPMDSTRGVLIICRYCTCSVLLICRYRTWIQPLPKSNRQRAKQNLSYQSMTISMPCCLCFMTATLTTVWHNKCKIYECKTEYLQVKRCSYEDQIRQAD